MADRRRTELLTRKIRLSHTSALEAAGTRSPPPGVRPLRAVSPYSDLRVRIEAAEVEFSMHLA